MLIADGAPKVRSALALLVRQRQQKAEILQAASTADVDRLVALPDIDLALVDWSLPRGGGRAAVETLRQRWPRAYIVVLSGRPEMEDDARSVCPDAFVSKGNPPDDLEEILDRVADPCIEPAGWATLRRAGSPQACQLAGSSV